MYKESNVVMNFHIAGFQYYDGFAALPNLKPGQKLKLVAVPDNPYDQNAVAVYRKGKMLGYIPRDMNADIAQMIHFGYGSIYEAFVMDVDKSADMRCKVMVTVRLRDNRKRK